MYDYMNDIPTTKTTIIPNTIKVRVFSAASSVDRMTGGASLYKVYNSPIHDEDKWRHRDITLSAPYANNAAILRGFVEVIRSVAEDIVRLILRLCLRWTVAPLWMLL